MLLPTNSSAPIGFQQDYYELPEKTKYLTTRCLSSSRKSKSPVREKSNDTLKRNRFRFCVCTGPRRAKKSTKWYVKVRSTKCCMFIFILATKFKFLNTVHSRIAYMDCGGIHYDK